MFLVNFSALFTPPPQTALRCHSTEFYSLETQDSHPYAEADVSDSVFASYLWLPTTDWILSLWTSKAFQIQQPEAYSVHFLDLSVQDAERFLKLKSTTTSLLSSTEKSRAHPTWLTKPFGSVPVWTLISTVTTCSALQLYWASCRLPYTWATPSGIYYFHPYIALLKPTP